MFLVVTENRIVRRKNRAATVAENHVDALVGQDLDNHLRAGHDPASERMADAAQFFSCFCHDWKCLTTDHPLQ